MRAGPAGRGVAYHGKGDAGLHGWMGEFTTTMEMEL